MNLKQLKLATYKTWKRMVEFNEALIQPRLFWGELKQYGDPNEQTTWERAYVSFEAALIALPGLMEDCTLILVYFCQPDLPALVKYNDLVLGEVLKYPYMPERLKTGIQDLWRLGDREAAVHFLKRLTDWQEHRPDLNLPPLALPIAA